MNGATFLFIWCLAGKVQTGYLCTEAISFIMEKSKWQKISICKCEKIAIWTSWQYLSLLLWQKLRDKHCRSKKCPHQMAKQFLICKWILFAISNFAIIDKIAAAVVINERNLIKRCREESASTPVNNAIKTPPRHSGRFFYFWLRFHQNEDILELGLLWIESIRI